MAKMFSEKASAVLGFMQAHRDEMLTAPDIAAGAGVDPKSITGVLNGLQKKGLVVRNEVEGFERKVVSLTDMGVAADPDADKVEE